MYLWKCWRDTRVRFAVTLILVTVSMVLLMTVTWNFATRSMAGSGSAERTRMLFSLPIRGADSRTVSTFWRNWINNLSGLSIYVSVVAWLWGGSAVGEEFSRNTEEFLLTRPRRRRRFVWVSWIHGVSQLGAAVISYVGVVFLVLVFLTKALVTWKVLSMVLPLLLLGMVVHSVVFLLTTVSRGRRDGNALALGVVFFYPLIVDLVRRYWVVHLPSPGDFIGPFLAVSKGLPVQLPLLSMVGWTLFAVACPLLAQVYIERSEV